MSSGPTNTSADRQAPSGPQLGSRNQSKSGRPWALIGGAFVAGTVLARIIDWRGHAHPRL
jgi:hypothetical protein